MIDINELRQSLGAIQTEEVAELLDRLEAAESDALEQARLNGMGSEREAALMAKLEAAEKERDALRAKIETAENDAAHQKALAASALRVAEGWERKCGELRAKVEAMEQQEPYAFAVAFPESSRVELVHDLDEAYEDMIYEAYEVRKLYLAHGAKGEEK